MRRTRRTAALLAGAAVLGWNTSAADGPQPEVFDTVVIDAGHGGEDEGARGPRGRYEKAIVLDVARRLAMDLRAQGLRVVMTRSDDVFVALEERTNIANDAKADLFISIHANSARDEDVRGAETFYLSLDASDESARQVALRENRAFEGQRGGVRPSDDPLLTIIGGLLENQHIRLAAEFSKLAQNRLAELQPEHVRGVKQAPFVVLMGVRMPATLVEIGFMTHGEEEQRLASARGQGEISSALVKAVLDFQPNFDRRHGSSAAALGAGR